MPEAICFQDLLAVVLQLNLLMKNVAIQCWSDGEYEQKVLLFSRVHSLHQTLLVDFIFTKLSLSLLMQFCPEQSVRTCQTDSVRVVGRVCHVMVHISREAVVSVVT